jgi:glycosyltransferase involved in cell wall biosynthesis
MKILFLSDDFPPSSLGGAGIVAHELAVGLSKIGHEIFVITTTRNKSEEGKSSLDGLKIFKIYGRYNPRWQSWLGTYNPFVVSRFRKIIKEVCPDVVHAHNIHYYLSYYSLKLVKKYSKAVFLTVHDVMLINFGKLLPKTDKYIYKISIAEQIANAGKRYNPFRNLLIQHYLKYVDKIFTVSNSLKKILEINGISNTETVYNGIDVDEWEMDRKKIDEFKQKYNPNKKTVIIFSARLIEAKGGDQLIQALALVNNDFPDFILLVVGKEWAYTEKIKKMSQNLNISEKVIFTGYLKEDELKLAYNVADISIFPSLCFESFGMGNLEAMACKKPAISSYFGGPSEVVIDGETGYLINPNNVKLMAEKILDLLENPEKAIKFGKTGHIRARDKFSLTKHIEETLKWYQLVLHK